MRVEELSPRQGNVLTLSEGHRRIILNAVRPLLQACNTDPFMERFRAEQRSR